MFILHHICKLYRIIFITFMSSHVIHFHAGQICILAENLHQALMESVWHWGKKATAQTHWLTSCSPLIPLKWPCIAVTTPSWSTIQSNPSHFLCFPWGVGSNDDFCQLGNQWQQAELARQQADSGSLGKSSQDCRFWDQSLIIYQADLSRILSSCFMLFRF